MNTETLRLVEAVPTKLSQQLHDLMNSLWAASVWIDLARSDQTCSSQLKDTLENCLLRIEEAMTIASQASTSTLSP